VRLIVTRDGADLHSNKNDTLMQLLKPGKTTMFDTEEYFHLALHASSVGDHHACMSYLEEVLQQEPRNARAIYLLAVQHAEIGLSERAIGGIKAALSIEPGMEIARFQLGLLLLFDKRRPAEAKEYLTRLNSSADRALRAYSEAMIAIADNDSALAKEKLALGLSTSTGSPALSSLMRRLFDGMSSDGAMGAPGKGSPAAEQMLMGSCRQT
jgi:tetratricopeptide (TPR) repeat protein